MRVRAQSRKLSGELSTVDVGNFFNLEARKSPGGSPYWNLQSVATGASTSKKPHRYNVRPHKHILSNPNEFSDTRRCADRASERQRKQ